MKKAPRLLCLDCDSTLSAVEGIDELARARGGDVFARVRSMTEEAMSGSVPVEAVFARRLDIIRPRRCDAEAVGVRYIETVEPEARAAIAGLRGRGWTPIIVSGGFRPAIRPLADHLGVERIEAVDLRFDPSGGYSGFDADYPTTRSGGKVEVVRRLRAELGPARVVLVGDAVSDLEVLPVVDLFVGFGRYAERERVRREAGAFIRSFAGLADLLRPLEG
jgi:phosphoserine phosphatase